MNEKTRYLEPSEYERRSSGFLFRGGALPISPRWRDVAQGTSTSAVSSWSKCRKVTLSLRLAVCDLPSFKVETRPFLYIRDSSRWGHSISIVVSRLVFKEVPTDWLWMAEGIPVVGFRYAEGSTAYEEYVAVESELDPSFEAY